MLQQFSNLDYLKDGGSWKGNDRVQQELIVQGCMICCTLSGKFPMQECMTFKGAHIWKESGQGISDQVQIQ